MGNGNQSSGVREMGKEHGNGTRKGFHEDRVLGEGEGNRESFYQQEFFWRIASESAKVFVRILDEFWRFFDLPKISVFSRRTIQNFMTSTPPLESRVFIEN